MAARLYCGMPVTLPPDHRSIDWTGVQPDDSPIEPLNSRNFLERLQRLEARARDIALLRQGMTEQNRHEERLHRDSERPS